MSAELVREFESLWESQEEAPDVFRFLSHHADPTTQDLLAVLMHDQQHRWRIGQPLSVEQYLSRLPQLASDAEAKRQLEIGDYLARRQGTTSPGAGDLTPRFDYIRDRLRRKSLGDDLAQTRVEESRIAATRTFIERSPEHVSQIGRYRLVRILGEGAFGIVYLAYDEELQRQVAVKIPTRERFRKPGEAAQYLEEARKVASLDHANIVPVYDTGRTDDGTIYVVSKFIEGGTLAERIHRERLPHDESAKLTATVARALHHAHERRLVHRDVKPGNILLEGSSDVPYVADFGLAIREEDYLKNGKIAGTPAYMSPEQARGEGHRLDCRSDIFSLGIVFYELLTGKMPFRGSTANELMHQVISVDPKPPQEVDAAVPAELQRICMRALAKRASERYASAAEFADDLVHWERTACQTQPERQIVPKGLRAFDAEDADFYVDLLPGPRNRHGLPESLQFWKSRIEQTDPDKTFSVGLMYGPSGCGKSSLVKAGLLPRLSPEIDVVYVETTPAEAETRLLRGLRKCVDELPRELGLVEAFAWLRRAEGRKVVVVLDQFEQWLHSHRIEPETELVSALRQCNGSSLQAIVLVRDDFAMAAARFMDSLDIPILQGYNFATVDLFDVEHAERVLIKFGQAFGKLPAQANEMSQRERDFVAAVASGLANEGKVVSVRLALFAEMVKGKAWDVRNLDNVGGTSGIGVNFLEETFGSRSANPLHRWHQQAARNVLQALLPEVGYDIKGHMKSHAELLEASGYRDQPRQFYELLRILDGELRLITPTDPEGNRSSSGSDASPRHYQLTHDYLVSSLQDWLTRKQRETRAGRASIRLAERTRMWRIRREAKQLPSWFEWLAIRTLTRSSAWSQPQREMMRAADRLHLLRSLTAAAIAAILLAGAAAGGQAIRRSRDAEHLQSAVALLFDARTEQVDKALEELERLDPERVASRLNTELERRPRSESDGLRADLFHASRSVEAVQRLVERMKELSADENDLVVQRLQRWKPLVVYHLDEWLSDESLQPQEKLRLACGLGRIAPHAAIWSDHGPSLAAALVGQGNPSHVQQWIERLAPLSEHLSPTIEARFSDPSGSDGERIITAAALAHFYLETPGRLLPLLGDADTTQLVILSDALVRRSATDRRQLADDLAELATSGKDTERANAALVLLRIRDPRGWLVLQDDVDYELRAAVFDKCRPFGIPPSQLLARLAEPTAEGSQQSLLLCLATYRDAQEMQRPDVIRLFKSLWREHPDSGVHSAAELVLRTLGRDDDLTSATRPPARSGPERQPRWFVNGQGITMIVVPPPQRFTIGSPLSESERELIEKEQRVVQLDYPFAVSAHEVTSEQFRQFDPDFDFAGRVTPSPHCPISNVRWFDAVKYCRWLSEQEGIPEAEMCYPPLQEIGAGMRLPDDWQQRTGYRLPTEEEWECICRAGTTTSRYFGDSPENLHKYAWYIRNSHDHLNPVGLLRPNGWGFFDVYGNVLEWCQSSVNDISADAKLVLRSGTYRAIDRENRSAKRWRYLPDEKLSFIGLRVARTMPSTD